MPDDKIDPALAQELDRLAANGLADRPVPVIVEHVEPASVAGEGDPGTQISELEQRVHALQSGILEQLRDLGVRDTPRQLTLANAFAAELTRSQIEEISAHPDVKRIQLSRMEKVTT
jgi:Peptidase inhibitor I9